MSARRARRRRGGSDLGVRILAAIPAIAYGIFIIVAGGWIFALGILLLGVVCLHELFRMYDHVRPIRLAGFLALGASPSRPWRGESGRSCSPWWRSCR